MALLKGLFVLGLVLVLQLPAGTALAATEVELYGTVIALEANALTVDVDDVLLALDVANVDPRFLESLRPGDEVRIAAFRLPDGGLLVYSIFLQAPGGREDERSSGPQGGPD